MENDEAFDDLSELFGNSDSRWLLISGIYNLTHY